MDRGNHGYHCRPGTQAGRWCTIYSAHRVNRFPAVRGALTGFPPVEQGEIVVFGRLVLLFTLVPAIEIYLLIQVGAGIGAVNTLLLILATGVVGAHYARLQGFYVLRRFQESLNTGQVPTSEIVDGAMLLLGGALLVTPGLLTDAVGFSLIFPPTRDRWKHYVVEWMRRKIQRGDIEIRRF